MKIGVISDVHDNLRTLSLVLNKLRDQEKVDLLINSGDWDMPFTMRTYVGFGKPIRGVLGNGDPDIQKFQFQLQNLDMLKGIDLKINFRFFDLNYDGKRIGVFHGDDDDLNKVLIESQLFDILCIGHNHVPSLTKEGRTIVLNTGSLVGFMAEKGVVPITYGLIDTVSGVVKVKDFEQDSVLFSSSS